MAQAAKRSRGQSQAAVRPAARVSHPAEAERPMPAHIPVMELEWENNDGWMRRSQVLFSKHSPRAAVLFVHGWGGSALSTWDRFCTLAREASALQACDLFFFGYPSRDPTVAFCASRFSRFLRDLLTAPDASIAQPTLGKYAEWLDPRLEYARVVVCAHSMGAVVARRALVDLDSDPAIIELLSRVRLLLFAPAHKGSHLPELIAQGFGLNILFGPAILGALLRGWYRSVDDLAIGSPSLKRLEEETVAKLKARPPGSPKASHLVADAVLHAQYDKVVSQEPFGEDSPMQGVMGATHGSICKPSEEFRIPIDNLARQL
jgi:pimeloyl-ACP methyl ester carboxylesterase